MPTFVVAAPRGFSFKRTAISHGWCSLPPFEFDQQNWSLTRVLDTGSGGTVTVVIRDSSTGIVVQTGGKLGKRAKLKVLDAVRHMLRLDDDMSDFYREVLAIEDFAWIAESGAGRLLRSPTVFEDLIKTICTTNCSWPLTTAMVRALVNLLGEQSSDGRRDFPTAEAMARQRESFYRTQVRAGYRAPYLKELADRVASGSLEVEGWSGSQLSTPELRREITGIKGVGPYAAESMLRLLGRYDCLALDSWVRAKFARVHNRGRAASDRRIERHYSRFGSWRGLALWCDMTRDWLDQQDVLKW